MNIKVIAAIAGVIVLGVVGIALANMFSGPDAGGTELKYTDEVVPISRPEIEAREDTFTIMTPEQKAAKDKAIAEAKAAELAAEQASSTEGNSDSEEESDGETN